MNRLFLVVLLAVLAQITVQKGTLYLNEIQSIPDLVSGVAQLPIECTLWVENEIYLDTIYAIPQIGTQQFRNHGVDIDGVLVYNGTWIFPSTFDVAKHVLAYGLIQPDGGWFCDDGGAGDVDGDGSDFSWSVEDNTGNTRVSGTLDIALGINNQDDINTPFATFDVKQSGETFIEGVLYPNGGINVLDGVFRVDDDGDIYGDGDLTVEGDLYYGREGFTGALSQYSIYFPPFSVDGGDLTLHGQDAATVGGDIIFVPGLPEGASINNIPGRVILGRRNENYDLTIARATTDNGDAGDYTISGQTSNARGGDLEFRAGNSIRIDYYTDIELGVGGDIILDPGLGVGGFGNIVLGDPNDGANIPYIITRPDIINSNDAGDTLFRGQDTLQSFRGGDLFVVAGDGSLRGGDIHLIPGSNGPFQADIKLGNLVQNRPENLLLGRLADPDDADASDTFFIGQDSTGSTGGDLWFVGGDGSDTSGGSIFISPGRRNGGVAGGVIAWGTSDDALYVERPYAYGDGRFTTIAGQDSTGDFPGGDLYFLAGDGTTAGGNLDLLAGDGDHGLGGDIIIQTGVGLVTGGDIQITSGDGFPAGDILIFGGRSGLTSTGAFPIDSNGGNIIIDAGVCTGLGCTNGEIQFNNAARVFVVNVPLLIDASTNAGALLHLNTGATSITFRSVPSANGFILYSDAGGNVYPLFQPRITLPSTIYSTINPYTNLVGAYNEVATNFAVLRAGLLVHGLIV